MNPNLPEQSRRHATSNSGSAALAVAAPGGGQREALQLPSGPPQRANGTAALGATPRMERGTKSIT